jgi:PAS domain S-box-containing protein
MMKNETEQMFESFFYQADAPICVIKADAPRFTIIAFNELYKKTTGTSVTDIIGKAVFEVYEPNDGTSTEQFSLLKAALQNCVDTQQQIKLPILSFDVPDASGTIFSTYWQIEINPVLDSQHKVNYMLCVTKNITEQEHTQKLIKAGHEREKALLNELKAVNAELDAKNKELVGTNAILSDTIDLLSALQDEQRMLNNELEERVAKRTEELTESENKLRLILNSIPQITWTSNTNGEVTFYNQRWYDYTRLDFEQTKAWGWKEVIHPDDLQYNIDTYSNIVATKQPGEFEVREKRFDGVYKWHLVRLEPLKDHDGEVILWIGTATDIQDLKDLQQNKDDFISIASHELKTPLTTLNASIQVLDQLKGDLANSLIPKMITQARKSMSKINNLVEGLLNASRLNQGPLLLTKSTFSLLGLLMESCDQISSANDYNFIIEGDDVIITADEFQIDQVIVNLVNNAVKYASNSLDIYIKVKKQENEVTVSVTDTGMGIPPEQIPRLFNRYFRGHEESYQYSGIGLGLFISAEIVKHHGGRMGVESKLGEGSTFWFTLPLNQPCVCQSITEADILKA